VEEHLKYYIGVDLGGTNLRAAMVDVQSGNCLTVRRALTPLDVDEAGLLARMAGLVNEVIVESGVPGEAVGGVGVGVPGLVDLERGVVLHLPNVPGNWPEVPFSQILGDYLGLPVSLLNDVRCITLAEWLFGAGRGVDTLACYAIGTGIGGGVVVGGRLHLGISGSAGELGHVVVEPDGPPCKCGGRGCLELYAAGPSIRAEGLSAVTRGLAPHLRELAGGDLNQVTVELMVAAAREGDADVRAIFNRAGRYLGIAIGHTLAVISPQRVIIAGGVAEAFDLLLDPVRTTLCERVFLVPVSQVEIVRGELGGEGGLIGAALWARENIR
jgi:glucokinase